MPQRSTTKITTKNTIKLPKKYKKNYQKKVQKNTTRIYYKKYQKNTINITTKLPHICGNFVGFNGAQNCKITIYMVILWYFFEPCNTLL